MTTLVLRAISEKAKLWQAFLEFRVIGYWARTEQPGLRAVPEDVIKRAGKWVLYDEREKGKFDADGNLTASLSLQHFSRDADEIARLVRQYGLEAVIEDGPRGEREVVILASTRSQ